MNFWRKWPTCFWVACKRKANKMRRFICLCALALVACGNEASAPEEVRPVRTLTVGETGVAAALEMAGEVRARHEVAQSFRIGGKLLERRVDIGNVVKAGEVLARLDAADVALNVAALQAQFDAAKTEVAQLELNLRRARDLLAQRFVSQAEVDSRQSAFDAGQRKLEQAHAQLRIARNQSAYANLLADVDGVVVGVEAEAGQVVAAGQTIVRVARAGEREVVVDVAEARRREVRVGQLAMVKVWAVNQPALKGRVREIAPAADASTRTYRTRIQLLDAGADIALGMSASVSLQRDESKVAGATLPLSAIYGEGAAAKVWIVDAEQRVRARAVKVIEPRAAGLLVNGVNRGEVVVTAGAHLLREGQKVRLMTAAEQR
jgi:membrane fusion protein, multidrug efflux system